MSLFDARVAEAVGLSLKVAAWCTALGTPPAVLAGWVLARKRFPGKALVSTLIYAPLVLPPVVTGFLLLRALAVPRTGATPKQVGVGEILVSTTLTVLLLVKVV